MTMRVSPGVHTAQSWRIREIAPDFRVEDVWEMKAPGKPDDLALAVAILTAEDPARSRSPLVRRLFALRWKIGAALGWDRSDAGLGPRVASLRDRLPADLRDTPVPTFAALPFTSLYVTRDEFAAEIANRTMHGILHLAQVPAADGPRGRMTVYVKPNGVFGRAYMLAIRPFRYLMYPGMLRAFERAWFERSRRENA